MTIRIVTAGAHEMSFVLVSSRIILCKTSLVHARLALRLGASSSDPFYLPCSCVPAHQQPFLLASNG